MMRSFVISAIFVATAALAGCSGTGDQTDDSTSSSADDLRGQTCGGFVAHPRSCPSGYVCIANAIPDLPGHCRKEKKCVENVICAISEHFDTTTCKCEPN